MKILTISKVCFFGALILGMFVVFSANTPQEMSAHAAVRSVGGCCCNGTKKDTSKCTGTLCFKSCYRCKLNSAYTPKCINGSKKCTTWPCSNECTPQTCDRGQIC